MGLRPGCFATVWEVKEGKGNYMDVQISTSKKVNDAYQTDYSGWVRFVGDAKGFASKLKAKDRIKINEFEVTNSYDKEKKVTYTNVAVFTAEKAESGNSGGNKNAAKPAKKANNDGFVSIPDTVEDEDLPFN